MKRLSLIVVTAFVLIASVGVAVRVRSRAAATALLPRLPELAGQPPAVVQHLTEADRAARASQASAAVVGALGMAYHADLFYDEAAKAYQAAGTVAPDDLRWKYLLALVHVERGEAAAASSHLREVLAVNSGAAIAWLRLGDAEFKRGRRREADEAYSRAENATGAFDTAGGPGRRDTIPISAYAGLARARIALQQDQIDRARQLLERVVGGAPRFGAAHRLLGDVYERLGTADKAARHVARAAALPPYNGPPDPMVDALARESRRSVLLLKQASAADLVRDAPWREYLVRRALEFDGANPDVVYEAGALLQQMKRPADALPYFQRQLDMVSDDQQTLVQIGKCYSDLGRFKEAETELRRALALADDAVGEYNLGYVLEQSDRKEEAEAHYSRAIALNPGLAAAHTNLGAALAARGRFADAVVHLSEAARLEPGNAGARNNLGALYLQRRQFDAAAREFRLTLDMNPDHADAHANLGSALAQQGAYDDAIRHFDDALRIDPRHNAAAANRQAVLARAAQAQGRR
jgi:tetratricopeptide (TPR) repeat protein